MQDPCSVCSHQRWLLKHRALVNIELLHVRKSSKPGKQLAYPKLSKEQDAVTIVMLQAAQHHRPETNLALGTGLNKHH